MDSKQQLRPVFFLMVSVFLTATGMMVVAPVMPFLVSQYVADPSQLAIVIGWLTATYSICQFVAAPGLGVLSDRYGRRPLLLICMFGSAIGYVLFGLGGALWVLVVGRVLDGVTGGDLTILMAYVADISEPEERGQLFGKVGAAVGAGFILGPVIGGLMAKLGVTAPLYLTAALTVVNMLWGYFGLPESLRPEHRRAHIRLSELNPFAQLRSVLAIARVRWPLMAWFFYGLAFVMMQTTLAVLVMEHLGWTADRIGLLLMSTGVIDILVQGLLIGRLLPRFGEGKLAIAGIVGVAIALALFGTVASLASSLLLVAGNIVYAISSGLLEPALGGLLSQAGGPAEQGVIQGGGQSVRSLSAIVGPLLAGLLYARASHGSPYWMGIVFMALALVVTRLALSTGSTKLNTQNTPLS